MVDDPGFDGLFDSFATALIESNRYLVVYFSVRRDVLPI